MALDPALSRYDSYEKPSEMTARSAFRVQAYLAVHGNTTTQVHLVFRMLIHERGLKRNLQAAIFYSENEVIEENVVKSPQVRAMFERFKSVVAETAGQNMQKLACLMNE